MANIGSAELNGTHTLPSASLLSSVPHMFSSVVPPNRSASSAQNGIKGNALKISGMPAAGMDPYSEEYATEQNDSYPGMEIYKGG